ncbi:mechanosensitive ion channel family protein [Aquisalimonas lutea]|uniref:mechanosensitive ion channel family protein n=1 Tax=Aquisalimonas lutea TaxID=1327750 RepID=UPI0025B4FAAE|nr:mechanosensitive ion channel family protein [Aquisalimonas lutea]MDN3516239.1 mechanosensitive ion channel family protein [Aquisalimonas lutea]
MGDLGTTLWSQLLAFNWAGLLRALIILGVGMLLARVVSRAAGRVLALRLDLHQTTILRRVIFYVIVGLAIASALHQLGFRLGVLLGAAGILTVAIGFASQTSASNLISGLFLIAERPFQIGDFIQVANEATGEVLSIDLLSVKMRTRDNLFVRVPNETLVKAQVTNYSRFPIRRYDLMLGVAYREDLDRVREALEAAADANPLCLEEPRPQIFFQGFGASSVDLQFSVWALRENFLDLRNSLPLEVKKEFDARGIEIPFPHLSLYAGSGTGPFPVTRGAGAEDGTREADPDQDEGGRKG